MRLREVPTMLKKQPWGGGIKYRGVRLCVSLHHHTFGFGPETFPSLYLSNFVSKKQGKGYGGKLLDTVLKVAAKKKLPVTLEAYAEPYGQLNQEQLVSFYERHGFKFESREQGCKGIFNPN